MQIKKVPLNNCLYVGIDLGKTGGIAVVDGVDGKVLDLYDMPATELEIVTALHDTIKELREVGKQAIVIGMEQTSARPGEGVVSVRTFALNCGGVYYTCLLLSELYDNITVSRISPALWKKHFGLISPKASSWQRKKDSVDYVNTKFKMNLKYNKNGIADALLIAQYLRCEADNARD